MLSGCVHFQADLVLNKDNTGKMIVSSAVNTDFVEEHGGDSSAIDDPDSVLNKLPGDLKGVKVVRKDLKYIYDESTYEGEEVAISFDNTEEFIKELIKMGEESIRIVNLTNGNKKLEFEMTSVVDFGDLSDTDSLDDLNIFELIEGFGGKMGFSIKTDYKVINHNASSEKNGLYTWNLVDILKNSKQNINIAFLEYKPESKEPSQPITGKTRSEVESSLGINLSEKDFHGNALNKLGILKGTDKGLELEKVLTRAEGATMYARLLGIESDIEKWAKANPNYNSGFKDLNWAKNTINYLHAKDLVKGVSSTAYGSEDRMSVNDYTTLVLRALGYNDSSGDFQWTSAGRKTQEIGLYSDDKIQANSVLEKGFTRGSMSYVSYNALFFKNSKTGGRLIDNLMD